MTSESPLLSRFSEDTLTFWEQAIEGTIHSIQRDPAGPISQRIGIFPIESSQTLSESQLHTLKQALLNPELWLLDARTRHLPNPIKLLALSSPEETRSFFIASGHQIGFFTQTGPVYADVKPQFFELLVQHEIM